MNPHFLDRASWSFAIPAAFGALPGHTSSIRPMNLRGGASLFADPRERAGSVDAIRNSEPEWRGLREGGGGTGRLIAHYKGDRR